MSKFLVGLDDGHGMETAGKRTDKLKTDLVFRGKTFKKGSQIHENDLNENLMELVEKGLDRCNVGHIQLASGDSDVPLADRVSLANRKNVDLVVSLHANALNGTWQTKAYGLVVIHHVNCSAKAKTLAKNCYNHISKDYDWYSNGETKYGVRGDTDVSGMSLYILRKTKAPSILIEYGFMDNWEDVKRMVTPQFQNACAEATVKGICETLGVKYIAPNGTTSTNNVIETAVNQEGLVNATSLNVRSGPGTNYSMLGKLPNNSKVSIAAKCNNGWLKIKYNNGYGYVSGDYIDSIKNVSNEFKVRIVCNRLNVREGASTKYKVVTQVHKGEAYTIIETKDNWGKLKSGAGWICIDSDYTQRI